MRTEKIQMIIRFLMEEVWGYIPNGNLILIVEDKDGVPVVFSNAPDREAVEEYLKSILVSKNKIDMPKEGETVN